MAEKIKVSELNASTTTNDSDLIMIVQENNDNELENFKQTRADFLAGINLSNYYTKTETDTMFGNYYTKSQTYTKTEIDDIIGDINTLLDTINGEVI